MSIAVATLVAAGATLTGAQVTVTLRPDSNYQTIEGFGAHGSLNVWWSGGPFYNTEFLNLVVDDLGLTMNRNEFYPDYSASNSSCIFLNKQHGWITALRDKAAASGEPMRFIASYWSPPAWMKNNNSTTGTDPQTNVLSVGREEALGDWGVTTVRAYKDHCDIDLYALSMQNEPKFAQTFNSCVYTPLRYRDVFKVFGARVHATYPNVKLFGSEHMLANWGEYEGQLNADSVARRHLDVFAVHGYSDGVHPTPNTQAVLKWKQAGTQAWGVGKPLWMTETSGYNDTWEGGSGAFHLAENIYAGLRWGRMAAWVWWQLSENISSSVYVFMYNGNPSKRYYVHKQYFRYIRPGAVMIGAPVTGDTLTFAAAFHHKQQQTLTVVLLNSGASSSTVSLSGSDLPAFQAYRTSSTENCVSTGAVGTSVSLPPRSITTLYGTGYDPSTPVVDPISGRVNTAALTERGDAWVYTLDGKRVATLRDVRIDEGRLRWNGRNSPLSRGTYYAVLIDRSGAVRANRVPVEIR